MQPMKMNRLQTQLMSWVEQCLLRRAPQDDPLSYPLLAGAMLAYLAVDLVQALTSSDWRVAFWMSMLDTSLMVLFAWLVLLVVGKTARLMQALTALAGTGALLGLLGFPLAQQAAKAHQTGDPMGALVLGWLLLFGWSITVQAHIFRHALSSRFGVGLLVACLHAALAISLLDYLFPRAAG